METQMSNTEINYSKFQSGLKRVLYSKDKQTILFVSNDGSYIPVSYIEGALNIEFTFDSEEFELKELFEVGLVTREQLKEKHTALQWLIGRYIEERQSIIDLLDNEHIKQRLMISEGPPTCGPAVPVTTVPEPWNYRDVF
jgi:hypothetical protein